MRIGIVTSSYPTSPSDTVNAGVFVRDLALEMTALGHEIHVVTPCKPEPVVSDPPLRVHTISWPARERDLASVSMHNPLTALRYAVLVASGLWNVPRHTRRQCFDALMAMWTIPSGLFAWAAWRRWGIPYGVWALGSDIWGRRKYPFGEATVRRVLRDAAFCFADGMELAQSASLLAGRECRFVSSARRLPCHGPSETELRPGFPHFLYIGRYERNKGPDILIEAMRILLDSGVVAYLHLFGGGSLEPSLRQRIRGHEAHIRLEGYAGPATVVAYMRACDWLVIPSRVESIPLVFGDACQMRLPVIATAVGDLGELVERYGLGRVVPSENPLALAQAMQWATQRTRAEFAAALALAADQFDVGRSAACCVEALSAAIQGRP